ncbi:peptidase domain-containing ABC transporter [Thiosocius teredinicola]|uniref:peptidase domain-containing ABC transporter n=1 Tax=Thiosocius teredinicola TaxID=1973002 RepID=UPI000990A644
MEIKELVEFLRSVEILSVFNDDELSALAGKLETQSYEFGDSVIDAGNPADGLYIVKTGTIRLFKHEHDKELSVGLRKAGQTLSELAILREHRHEYSARASSDAEVVMIPRSAITPILKSNAEAASFVTNHVAISSAGGLLTQIFDLRRKVKQDELEDLVRSIGVKRFSAGTAILEQDGSGDRRLYFVRTGTVKITRAEKKAERHLATIRQGESFGEKAALTGQRQPFAATAETDVTVMIVPERTVKLILDRNPDFRQVLEKRAQATEREFERQEKLAAERKRTSLFDLRSKSGPGQKVLRRFPLVEQAEEMDCGAACLAMIAKHYKIPITLGKLREMANVTTEGATLDSLAKVGESLGFTTRGLKCDYDSLLGLELPIIAHWEGYHYVVIYGVSKTHVWIADPAIGFVKMDRARFEQGWAGIALVFTPSGNLAQFGVSQSPWRRFASFLAPYKKTLGYLLMATLVIEALGIAPPVIVQNVLDNVIVHQNLDLLTLLIVGLVLTHVFMQTTTAMRGMLSNFLVRNLDFSMMSSFFKHTLALPLSFFTKRRTGDIFARFQENATIRSFLTESTISTLLNVLMMFVYLIVLFIYSVKLTVLLLILIVPIALLTLAATPKIKQYARRTFEASTEAEAVLMETISSAETVKAMGVERSMRLKWESKYANALNVQYDAAKFELGLGVISQLLNASISVTILWVGAQLVVSQELTAGQLIAFNMLVGSVMSPIMGIIGLWDELHEAGVSMERLGDVLDLDPEQKPSEAASRIVLPDLKGDIRVENLFFRYGGKETPYVLKDISFSMKAGEQVAIVGLSGSGKTTLAKLLVGFFPPTEGKIYIDGYDLELVDLEYLRRRVGYVMQSNLLFSGTISENIALGDENPDRRRIVEVAKHADAHRFVSNLPLGYEQVVGERGVGLSGGQIQRICIARALYHDPQLLIFDEATSALDSQSESNILTNMQHVFEGRTSIVIAHRLSTVMNADKILVLYEGDIAEEGTHQELVDRKGMYYQLVRKQMANER